VAASIRTLVVWCRDWPVVALDVAVGEPVAVLRANRVVATSAAARVAGVVEGQRRREAQRRCPEVTVVERDVDLEARAFDRVVGVLDDIAPRIEIVRPGVCAIPTRGPSRYFGGDPALADLVRSSVGAQLDDPSGCGVGIADGPFPATLAARRSLGRPGAPPMVIAAGASGSFVGPMPTATLASPGPLSNELVEVMVRLGLVRLSDLAGMDPSDLADRFGADGVVAHRLASGLDDRVPHLIEPPPDLTCTVELDPPAERVDQAAFAGKTLADGFADELDRRALAATRVAIAVHTTGGAVIERLWRDGGTLSAAAIAQRIRWQLDGWLSRPHAVSRGGVCRIELRPEDVGRALARQDGLWGGADERDERARRAAARLVALVGPASVRMPEPGGGRSAGEQMRLVPMDLVDPAGGARAGVSPWPGSIPAPHPTMVLARPADAEVVDARGRLVMISARGVLSGTPTRMSIRGGPWEEVGGWAGPWLTDERWWDPEGHRRRARVQVITASGVAHLLAVEDRRWWVEGTYD